MSVVWSDAARQELRAIYLGVERASPEAGIRLVDRRTQAGERLETFPELGRIIPDYDLRQVRELLVGNYRLAYHVSAGQIEILAVFHGSQSPFG